MAPSKEMQALADTFVGKVITAVKACVARASKPHSERLDRLEARIAELEKRPQMKRGKDAR